MRAVLYEQFGGPVAVREVPDPEPSPDGVVVRVGASGICRSDWHGWVGHDADIDVPHVPGHELAGVIDEVGSGVGRWRVGDRVTVPFVAGCTQCAPCLAGDQQVCENQFQPGFTAWGSFAERVALRHADANLVRLPDSMAFTTAASLGCRFATSFRAVVDQGRIRGGEWMAVHGAGGVGLSAVMIGAAMGAQVVAVDIRPEALELAASLGAVATVDATQVDDVPAAVHEATRGGAHVSVDALGSAATARNSVLSLRRRGRHVQVGLMVESDAEAGMAMDRVVAWELELYGSHGMQAHRYDAMLAMVESGVLAPQRLVTRAVSLDEAPEVLVTMDDFDALGVVVIDRF